MEEHSLQLNELDDIKSNFVYSSDTINYISSKEFHKLCRTCLAEGEFKPICEETFEDKPLIEVLKLHTTLEVFEEDSLPQNICHTCVEDLFRAHTFAQRCQQSDVILRYVMEIRNQPEEKEQKSILEKDNESASEETTPFNTDSATDKSDEETKTGNHFEDTKTSSSTKRRSLKKTIKHCRKVLQRRQPPKIQGPPFQCRDCDESYNVYEDLKSHRKQAKHPEARNHACSICSKMFTSSKLRQHMRAHTKEKPYQCSICFQSFSMSGNLKRHMMTHTGERPHVCEVCGKGFIQATTLQNHRKTHAKYERIGGDANSPHFACDYCGRGFKRIARYNAHLKRHFSDNSETKKQLPQDEGPREHICMICKRAYKTKHLLKAHQLTHGEKTFLCSECGKSFVTKAALQSHLKVHTGEKPHTCNVCKKSFAHVGSFEAHMLIHTGQKPYNCNICTKAFTQLSHLKYHLRTHSGERPYVCSFCGKSFALKGNLTVHVRTHTGETPYVCPMCGKGFYDSSSMKKHKKGHGEMSAPPVQVNSTNMNMISANAVDVINSMNCVDLNALIS